jgi:sirohydrochlorin cobaltochelatase
MKKGIIVVSFGTSYLDTLKRSIEAIETRVAEEFEDYHVLRAFTSKMIVKKIKERDGIEILNTEQALKALIDEGYTEIIVQPLHVIPGYEYEKVKHAVAVARHHSQVTIKLGTPLLNHHEDYLAVIGALQNQLPIYQVNKGILLMGHGTHHHANACFVMLERLLRETRSDVHIANVEGYPELEDIITTLEHNYDTMTVMPFMIVAGDHARNDMAGDEKNSFKSQLEAAGIEVDCQLIGLGENQGIQDIFIDKIEEIIGG